MSQPLEGYRVIDLTRREGAFGALGALHERRRSGRGLHVDISTQQCVTICTQSAIVGALVNGEHVTTCAKGPKASPIQIRLTCPAKDGYASITHIFGASVGLATKRLMEYVHDQGFCDATMRDKDWVGYGQLLATDIEPLSEFERAKEAVAACTAAATKADLLDEAMKHRLLLAPVSTMVDVVHSPQFEARDCFQQPVGEPDRLKYPGPFARFSATPIRYTRPAPTLDAHRQQILDELDVDKVIVARESTAWSVNEDDARPLSGLKVLDLMWAIAGPQSTRSLADFGATIVRIESSSRLDVCRTVQPFMNRSNDPEESALFHGCNVGKLMLTLDLTKPDAKAVVLDREPVGPFGAYTDYIAPRYNGAALLAALEHRRRTGEGQYIDMSQAEAAIHFLAPAVLGYLANDHVTSRMGNGDLQYAPHAAYPADGRNRWIGFACETDAQWQTLAPLIGLAPDDPRYATAASRKAHEAELDVLIGLLTQQRDPNELAEALQALGIPAYPVQNSAEAVVDPQLLHLQHFKQIPHPHGGHTAVEGSRARLSRTPGRPGDTVPTFGAGMTDVLEGILGYDAERIGELLVAGILE